ncbi:MAG TPA: SufD family Fe-S cluster assembly protein [archaeon]|nr:SufD family Fe-S cluster assembly protein [archaeon]
MQLMKEPEWMSGIRTNAQEKLAGLPMPQEREEAWRYTDLRDYSININDIQDSEVLLDGTAQDVIFTDLLSAVMEHPEIVRKYIGKAVEVKDRFSAMHYANITNGILVFVPDGRSAKLSSKISGSCHTIIVTGRNSRLEYTEEYVGGGFATDATEIFTGEDSVVNFLSIQKCDDNAKRFSFHASKMQRNSTLNWTFAAQGAAFHRSLIDNNFSAEDTKSETLCAFRTSGRQHADFMVNLNHTVPQTTSNLIAKGVLGGSSTSIFRGMIRIGKEAQKTSSFLQDHALLISDKAIANNIPGLLIDANDVAAKHAATVGQLDEEQLFYLMSRGLSREDAEHLIIEGFLGSLAAKIESETLRQKFVEAMR